MSIDSELTALDTEPDFDFGAPVTEPQPTTVDLVDLKCSTCGSDFQKPKNKNGNYPKQCDDCKAMKVEAPTTSKPKRSANSTMGKLERNLTEQLAGMGAMIGMFETFDGLVIAHNAATVSSALCTAAEANPALKKALEGFLTGSAYGQIGFAMAGMMVPILANHDILPPQTALFGNVPNAAKPYFKGGSRAPKETEESVSEAEIPLGQGVGDYMG